MEDIIWFNKDRTGYTHKRSDVSINKNKDCVSIIIRNDWVTEVTQTGYIRIGMSPGNKNRLYFMAADEQNGWKMSNSPNSKMNYKTTIRDDKVIVGLVRFIGDYDMEVSEDNLCYIDRRNAKE